MSAERAWDVTAIVTQGTSRHFVGGADIAEFDATPRAPKREPAKVSLIIGCSVCLEGENQGWS